MSNFSDYLENELLDHVFREDAGGTAFPQPTELCVSLHTEDPTDDGTGAEVTGGSYARVDSTGKWGAPADGVIATDDDLTFPTASAGWGTVTHFGIWDAEEDGN